MMGSYCHCQQVVTFFFFFFFFGLHLTTWVKGPTLTLCPGPLNFSGRPCPVARYKEMWCVAMSPSYLGKTKMCITVTNLKLSNSHIAPQNQKLHFVGIV